MMWYWGNGGVHWWGWFIGFIITVVLWALFIYLIISIMRGFAGRDHRHEVPDPDDPERVLARRFANGEIDEDEFHQRIDVLRSHGVGKT